MKNRHCVTLINGACFIHNPRRSRDNRCKYHGLTPASERRLRRWMFERLQDEWAAIDAEQRDYQDTQRDTASWARGY